MKLSKLYSRRSDGKVQVWTIEIDGNRYRTASWINPDGACTPAEWTVCEKGKQKRTPEQQAEFEARAAHKKKLDQGGYCENEADIDKAKFFSPMLAKIYEDYSFDVQQALEGGEKVWVQPKLDGMRCIAQRPGLTSRNGKPIICAPHIQDAVNSRFTSNLRFVVDGELYSHKLANDFEQIMSLAKKTQPDFQDLIDSKNKLQYHIYDLPLLEDENGPLNLHNHFNNRLEQMRFLFSACPLPIVLVETHRVKTLDEIGEHFARWRAEGYEGAMIRLDRDYQVNKRSKYLLKFKKFLDAEFEIVRVNEGVGNRSGMAGSLTCKMSDGRTFDCGIRGDIAGFKSLWMLRDTPSSIVGRRATITYHNLTQDGIPRFPIFLRVRENE